MKILMISATFPYPPSRGGTQVRTFNFMKYLSQKHAVTLVTQSGEEVGDCEIEQLRGCVSELRVFRRPKNSPENRLKLFKKLQRFGRFIQTGIPPSVLSSYSIEMQEAIDAYASDRAYDVVTCEHSVNEIYVRPEWCDRLPTVANIHSSIYGTYRQQVETSTSEKPLRDRVQLPLIRRYERGYCRKFSALVVTTEDDARQFREFGTSARLEIIANGVDFDEFTPRERDPGGYRIVFIGAMDNLPNIDAARFFALEVLPLVQIRYPETTFEIAGARPVPSVLELQNLRGVTVTGTVPAIADYLHQATVCVVPMRTGYGIKNKTLQAMAAGTPVVASDRGLEGLKVEGSEVPLRALRANQVNEYVYAIGRLFEDRRLREQLSRQGRKMVEREYNWEILGRRYEQLLLELVESRP